MPRLLSILFFLSASVLAAQNLSKSDIESMVSCGFGETACDAPVLRLQHRDDCVVLAESNLATEEQRLLCINVAVTAMTPKGVVWSLAQTAKKELRPFTVPQMTEYFVNNPIDLNVVINAFSYPIPLRNRPRLPDIKRIVIRTATGETLIQPIEEEENVTARINAFGVVTKSLDRSATFRVADLPQGDFTIVVVADHLPIPRDKTEAEPLIFLVDGKAREGLR